MNSSTPVVAYSRTSFRTEQNAYLLSDWLNPDHLCSDWLKCVHALTIPEHEDGPIRTRLSLKVYPGAWKCHSCWNQQLVFPEVWTGRVVTLALSQRLRQRCCAG